MNFFQGRAPASRIALERRFDTQVPLESRSYDADRKNLKLLIYLRWVAVAGQVTTIAFVELVLGIPLPTTAMLLVLLALAGLNLVSLVWLRRGTSDGRWRTLLALVIDLLALTTQLALSGGATNPFVSLYLLPITLSAVLLDRRTTFTLIGLTVVLFSFLVAFGRPLELPSSGLDLFTLYIFGVFLGLLLGAVLVAIFMSEINRNLRQSDERLAALRERAAEEDHILRMGLLASNAAHELGTPLASISVILSDWRRMPRLAKDPDLILEIGAMEAAANRCKKIVTEILMSVSEENLAQPAATTVNDFIEDLVEDWRVARSFSNLRCSSATVSEIEIVPDDTVRQVVQTVLDNAADASPDWVHLHHRILGDRLAIVVADNGPGFSDEIIDRVGIPFQSTKGRAGRGLGLFLVMNTLRKLGGTLIAANQPGGGAEVTIEIPLIALTVPEDLHAR